VADFEAGVGTLSRMKPGQLDLLLVVTEPTAKALEVARRAAEMIRARDLGRALLVANRVAAEDDRRAVERALTGLETVVVPDDPAIRIADAHGRAPFDASPTAPAVHALRALAGAIA